MSPPPCLLLRSLLPRLAVPPRGVGNKEAVIGRNLLPGVTLGMAGVKWLFTAQRGLVSFLSVPGPPGPAVLLGKDALAARLALG